MIYKISDLFYSLQGEGYYAGRAAVFVRFYGCNLSCKFCDEELHRKRYQAFNIDKLITSINKYGCDFVVITGGEPSLYDLNSLIITLKEDYGKYVAVETNGYNIDNIFEADWITYSPKDWNNMINGWDEIKFVVNQKSNVNQILEIEANKLIYLQPEALKDDMIVENVERCVNLVKKHPHLRLSLQTHKLIGIK